MIIARRNTNAGLTSNTIHTLSTASAVALSIVSQSVLIQCTYNISKPLRAVVNALYVCMFCHLNSRTYPSLACQERI